MKMFARLIILGLLTSAFLAAGRGANPQGDTSCGVVGQALAASAD
jgi:hypothetical protein